MARISSLSKSAIGRISIFHLDGLDCHSSRRCAARRAQPLERVAALSRGAGGGASNWGAFVPDVPDCVAVGESREDVVGAIQDALAFHLRGLVETGEPIPPPGPWTSFVGVDLPAEALGPTC
ncbi:MAG: type II toxin-antitoxin system HicB family antitoxin [Chloroflexi bacterium]|nr:type II toxin-antitoxin system HicB family antitoxin [Chloroflexota bacterium]